MPLILIDNVEGDLDMVNPEDIETVTVLKDAASQGDLAQVHINGGCHRDAELLQHVFGLLLDSRVDTKIERHCFFHGYHLGFIVTYFALHVNRVRSRN